ncbi:hypothetical protein [Actinomadura bangladeshensis]|uniref:Uncharacterized protein n=1 Tax=Actinomadura bangladeshensis TaxID=453573 RepID=A0A6L9QCY6_9ACTN|nr:hypothetical protein [Actinomadura bangladeshensis]NEA21583.1 hypothetical protein [Actinomadura bangladeshensis]NEA22543.1 hypothetical protein [Actinomadura bangladeshensis]
MPDSTHPAPANALGRPIAELRDSGLLWLMNRVVFHPRGLALALHADSTGQITRWSLLGDGSEAWSFPDEVDQTHFRNAEATLCAARARSDAPSEPLEPTVRRSPDVPARGVHVIPGSVPEGVVPPSTSMATPRPDDVSDELLDDLAERLIKARLTARQIVAADGYAATVIRSDAEAADAAAAVVAGWLPEIERRVRAQVMADLFGAPEEIARREAEAAQSTPDDTVRLCEMAQPGEHERQARGKVAADLKRAAAGRRDYASHAPEHIVAELEAEARVFDTASRVATQPSEVMWGLLPAAMWTDADRPTERREPW